MGKMVILELTEKEAELVQKLALNYGLIPRNKEVEDFTDYERRIDNTKNISDKVDLALKSQPEFPITDKDLMHIISMAKDQYLALPADLHISNKKVREDDFKHISLASAVVVWLNSKNLLKRLAAFEFTDHAYDFEDTNE